MDHIYSLGIINSMVVRGVPRLSPSGLSSAGISASPPSYLELDKKKKKLAFFPGLHIF